MDEERLSGGTVFSDMATMDKQAARCQIQHVRPTSVELSEVVSPFFQEIEYGRLADWGVLPRFEVRLEKRHMFW